MILFGGVKEVYDVQWQVMRISLLGTWTNEMAKGAIEVLQYYRTGPCANDRPERIWRILNLCNAVLLRIGRTTPISKPWIISARDEFSSLHAVFHINDRRQWSWVKVQNDLRHISDKSIVDIQRNLAQRVATAFRRVGGLSYRPELNHFLQLLEEERIRRTGEVRGRERL